MKYVQLRAPMPKKMRLFAPVAVVAMIAIAQPAPQPAAGAADKKPIRVEGRVVGFNGAPVRKANVHLQGSGAAVPVQNGQGPPTTYKPPTTRASSFSKTSRRDATP